MFIQFFFHLLHIYLLFLCYYYIQFSALPRTLVGGGGRLSRPSGSLQSRSRRIRLSRKISHFYFTAWRNKLLTLVIATDPVVHPLFLGSRHTILKFLFNLATFKITPALRYQTFIISAEIQEKIWIPCVYALLPNKRGETYASCLFCCRVDRIILFPSSRVQMLIST